MVNKEVGAALAEITATLNRYSKNSTSGGRGRTPLHKQAAENLIQFIYLLRDSGVTAEDARSKLSEIGVSFAHEMRQNRRPSLAEQDQQERVAAGLTKEEWAKRKAEAGQKGKERAGSGGSGGHPRFTPGSSFMKG